VAVHCALRLFLALRVVAAHAGRVVGVCCDCQSTVCDVCLSALKPLLARCCSVLCAAHCSDELQVSLLLVG
jgi:hypothetical protein